MRQYWQGLAERVGVPAATGAEGIGLNDVTAWCEATGFRFEGRVLDIGCGTGRLAALCEDYTGVDIAPAMVAFARDAGRNVSLIAGPDGLPPGPFDRVACLSVMTHIDRNERYAYLGAIASVLAPGGEALIDILPGTDSGTLGCMSADPDGFVVDLMLAGDAGLGIVKTFDWLARDGTTHRYYRVTVGE